MLGSNCHADNSSLKLLIKLPSWFSELEKRWSLMTLILGPRATTLGILGVSLPSPGLLRIGLTRGWWIRPQNPVVDLPLGHRGRLEQLQKFFFPFVQGWLWNYRWVRTGRLLVEASIVIYWHVLCLDGMIAWNENTLLVTTSTRFPVSSISSSQEQIS